MAEKPGRWYAGLEFVIGLWALVLSFAFPWANHLAQGLSLACIAGLGLLLLVEYIYSGIREWLGQGMAGAMGGEICAAAVVLLLPTILMGITFSHLAQSACGKKGGLGRALSVNTVGAAGAPFLFGVVVLPAIGLKTALVLVAVGYLFLIPMPVFKTIVAGHFSRYFPTPLPLRPSSNP